MNALGASVCSVGNLCSAVGCLWTHRWCLCRCGGVPLWAPRVLWGAMVNTLSLGREPSVWVLTFLEVNSRVIDHCSEPQLSSLKNNLLIPASWGVGRTRADLQEGSGKDHQE